MQFALLASTSAICVEPWTVDTVLPHIVSRLSTLSGLPLRISSIVPRLKKSTKSTTFSRSGVSFISVNVMSMRLASMAGRRPLNGIALKAIVRPIFALIAAARSTITPCSVVPSSA